MTTGLALLAHWSVRQSQFSSVTSFCARLKVHSYHLAVVVVVFNGRLVCSHDLEVNWWWGIPWLDVLVPHDHCVAASRPRRLRRVSRSSVTQSLVDQSVERLKVVVQLLSHSPAAVMLFRPHALLFYSSSLPVVARAHANSITPTLRKKSADFVTNFSPTYPVFCHGLNSIRATQTNLSHVTDLVATILPCQIGKPSRNFSVISPFDARFVSATFTEPKRYRPTIPKVRYSESPLCRYAPQC